MTTEIWIALIGSITSVICALIPVIFQKKSLEAKQNFYTHKSVWFFIILSLGVGITSLFTNVYTSVQTSSFSTPVQDGHTCSEKTNLGSMRIHTTGSNEASIWFCAQQVENGEIIGASWFKITGIPQE